jgi:hypothetical protein
MKFTKPLFLIFFMFIITSFFTESRLIAGLKPEMDNETTLCEKFKKLMADVPNDFSSYAGKVFSAEKYNTYTTSKLAILFNGTGKTYFVENTNKSSWSKGKSFHMAIIISDKNNFNPTIQEWKDRLTKCTGTAIIDKNTSGSSFMMYEWKTATASILLCYHSDNPAFEPYILIGKP